MVVMLVPVGSAGAEPSSQADGPNIVYVTSPEDCEADCTFDIYLAHPDGSEPTRLTDNDLHESDTSWSPDGRLILFVRASGEGGSDIWVMDANGSNPTNLTNSPLSSDQLPQWSPDGTRIVFVRGKTHNTDFTPRIFSMNADGSEETVLAENATGPRWSPDGGLIAFRRHTATTPLTLMKSGGEHEHKIDNAFDYDWSPDGRQLVFARYAPPNSRQIRVVDADGTNNHSLGRIADHLGTFEILWSPAEDRIAVGAGDDDHGFLYVADPDGGLTRVSSRDPADLAWSPSGTQLAYSRCTPDCSNEIHVINFDVADYDATIATEGDDWGQDLAWQPVCTVEGTEASETLEGTSFRDLICGLGGNDEISGLSNGDVILGGDGDDSILGAGGKDTIYGGEGTDTLRGGEDNDLVTDLSGLDVLLGGPGDDVLGSRDQSSGDRIGAGAGGDLCRADPGDLKEGCS